MRKTQRLSATQVAVLRERLRLLFADLRKEGAFARMNWKCCQTCGNAAVPTEHRGMVAFFHAQDADRLSDGGTMVTHGWAYAPDEMPSEEKDARAAKEMVKRAGKFGLRAEWDGSDGTRVWLQMDETPEVDG